MRLTFLLTQDLDSPSGLGRYWPLARELARLGHRVTVAGLHPDLPSLPAARFSREGVDICYVAPMHVQKTGNIKRYYSSRELLSITARAAWQLTKSALTVPSDIFHVGKPHPMNGLAGWISSRLQRQTLFVDCDDDEAGSGRFSSGWQQQSVAFFERQIPRQARYVTTNTQYMRQRLIEFGVSVERIVYLPNGVDRQRTLDPPLEQVEALRQELGLEGKQVIAYLGSLSLPSHPVDLLIDAFPLILAQNPQAVLLLVGGGEDYENLKRKAGALGLEHQVRFCGRVAPDQVPLYYRLANVSVDPVYDNPAARGRCPLKLFESWANGVPFVTADVGDRAWLIGDPPAGLIAQPGDKAALAQAICQVLEHPDLAQALRRLGLQRVEAYYWDRLVHQIDVVYRQFASPGPADPPG